MWNLKIDIWITLSLYCLIYHSFLLKAICLGTILFLEGFLNLDEILWNRKFANVCFCLGLKKPQEDWKYYYEQMLNLYSKTPFLASLKCWCNFLLSLQFHTKHRITIAIKSNFIFPLFKNLMTDSAEYWNKNFLCSV